MTWLAKVNGGQLPLDSLKATRGLIDGTDWDCVRMKFGRSEVTVTWEAGERDFGEAAGGDEQAEAVSRKYDFREDGGDITGCVGNVGGEGTYHPNHVDREIAAIIRIPASCAKNVMLAENQPWLGPWRA
ncbi:hypothetical protein CYMTET_51814 [Cymbomonas tetramitiformis]|uniref:Uncharacterized protein n=1 Tax=Cymbomonas tetramitiformis TaxID=36881 RepID=A0AAE0BKI2_9CHLO|nr:hypothetical protein CYMTET_51814 [Cymbomonas tetramitiformis]